MFNSKLCFIYLLTLLSALCFADQIDPATAISYETGNRLSQVSIESEQIEYSCSRDTTPPSFTISHTESGSDVTINVVSSENLFPGWVAEKELWYNSSFDFWSLTTRMAIDEENDLYAAVKLWEYSNPNTNYDMFFLENNGEISEQYPDWNGPGNNTLIINNPSPNIYIGKTHCERQGVVDSNNITYVFGTTGSGGDPDILFTKIDADGSVLVNNEVIITGVCPWTNEVLTDIAPDGRVYIVWSNDMHDIMYAYSDNGGDTWSSPASICYNASDQLNRPQVCCDSNGNLHVIWQHWTGTCNRLSYMKLLPNGTVSIDESFLTPTSITVWTPMMDIDEENNLHIVWAKSKEGFTTAYYTKINGNLDGGGSSIGDEELSIIQEIPYIINEEIRYPRCIVDAYMNIHTVFERGEYGRNKPKWVYYKKMNSIPLLKIECPDESILFVEMTGSGTVWEGTFTPPETGIYSVRVSASDIDGNTGIDYYQFEYTGTGIDESESSVLTNIHLSNYPNPFNSETTISFSLPKSDNISLEVFNIRGQLVETLVTGHREAGEHSAIWDAEDISSGIYFYRILTSDFTDTKKCILVE